MRLFANRPRSRVKPLTQEELAHFAALNHCADEPPLERAVVDRLFATIECMKALGEAIATASREGDAEALQAALHAWNQRGLITVDECPGACRCAVSAACPKPPRGTHGTTVPAALLAQSAKAKAAGAPLGEARPAPSEG